MFARAFADLERDGLVRHDTKASVSTARYLGKQDGLGFTLTCATLRAGGSQALSFTNHWETNLVLDGRGSLTNGLTEERHDLEPGTLWIAGPDLPHRLEAEDDLKVLGMFNPALDRHARPGLPRCTVRSTGDLEAMGRGKKARSGNSDLLRYLLAEDGMGFTLSDCRMVKGCENRLWYRNHWEANLILAGEGSVEDLGNGTITPLFPGVLYCVGPHDRHVVRTTTPMHLLSLFNPPLAGDELHDDEGGYPPTGRVPPGPAG